jgi:hypothetical protein
MQKYSDVELNALQISIVETLGKHNGQCNFASISSLNKHNNLKELLDFQLITVNAQKQIINLTDFGFRWHNWYINQPNQNDSLKYQKDIAKIVLAGLLTFLGHEILQVFLS